MDYTTETIKDGKRYHYKKSNEQSKLPNQFVQISEIKGFWQIRKSKKGTNLVFETTYDAGGSVPNFLIRWFQGIGTRNFIAELKKFAKK